MTDKKEKMGPLARRCRMVSILNKFRWLKSFKRTDEELRELALVGPWIAEKFGNASGEDDMTFVLRDAAGRVVKSFQSVDMDILRETTPNLTNSQAQPVYWIYTASGCFISTKGDSFEYLFEQDDDFHEDAWHLREHKDGRKNCWTDTVCKGNHTRRLYFEQLANGAIITRRENYEGTNLVSVKGNGRFSSFKFSDGVEK
ncbi:MAG: hypothetical protein J6Y85_02850 [Alphaproteobacteria bacterium]|nr:hypothetical protein [Alphaproteobacteria bacterium]